METPFFVRVPGESTELLAIDRHNEYFNAKAAAETGVGPQVLYYLPEFQVMVLEFLRGRPCRTRSLNAPVCPPGSRQPSSACMPVPDFLTDFNMFRLTEYYLDICKQRRIRIPDGYPERMPAIGQIEQALAGPTHCRPSHAIMIYWQKITSTMAKRCASSIMNTAGTMIRASNWGIPARNCNTMRPASTRSVRHISEVLPPDKIARMKLNMIMSDVGWGLWAAIQAKISKIEYDFWGWAVERWGRAVEKMDSPEFPALAERCSG